MAINGNRPASSLPIDKGKQALGDETIGRLV
jgi:hypothetical protein